MGLFVNNTEIEGVILNGVQELDEVWVNGVQVYISTIFIPKPTAATTAFTYNTAVQSLSIDNYDDVAMEQVGDVSATNAGNYSVTYKLKKGFAWLDETYDDVTINWNIGKMPITIPTLTNISKTYNAGAQSPTSNHDTTWVNISGNSQTNAGNYTTTWTLKDTANTQWTDGETIDKTASWSIGKATLNVPTISGGGTYNGSAYTVTVNGFNSNTMTQGGTASATNVGTYTVTWALKDTNNYQWNTTASRSWNIDLLYIAKPWLTNTSISTTGNYVSPTFNGENLTWINRGGTTGTSSIGSWSVTWTLKDTNNTRWSDGSVAAYSYGWSTYAGTIYFYVAQGRSLSHPTFTFATTYGTYFSRYIGTLLYGVGTSSSSYPGDKAYISAVQNTYNGVDRVECRYRATWGTEYLHGDICHSTGGVNKVSVNNMIEAKTYYGNG